MEILQLISSIITPILVVFVGIYFSKILEKNKLIALKDKEWKFKWAELFLSQAIDFNENVSKIACELYYSKYRKDNLKNEIIFKRN